MELLYCLDLTNYAAGKGSSVVAMFYSLQGIIDTIQIFALIVSSVSKF